MKKKKTILLIEDDRNIRDLYLEILTEAGFKVMMAINGEDGLKQTCRGGFDLILLDLKMPKKDGLQLLLELKKHPPKKKNGPIILLTNMAQKSVIEEGLKLGAKSFLVKTDLDPAGLVKKIRQSLE